jgi:uncharacterized RDD family membrane protein YckC
VTDAAVRAAQIAAAEAGDAPPQILPADAPPQYVGLVTRAVAIVIDAIFINVVAVVTGAAIALLMDTLSFPSDIRDVAKILGGFMYTGWVVLYFVLLWAVEAQTIGGRVMGFRVQHPEGNRMRPRTSIVRFGAMVLAALPLGAGFIRVLYDDRRRGFHDRVVDTVVVVGEGDRPGRRRVIPAPPVRSRTER